MYSMQDHCTDDQIVCWNCEEAVHQSALQCPYCYAELHRHPVQKATKITVLDHKIPTPAPESGVRQSVSFVLSLLFLLAGSSLFFLSLMIALFAKDGSFTISWSDHAWTAFFGLGLAFVSFGVLFLQQLSSDN